MGTATRNASQDEESDSPWTRIPFCHRGFVSETRSGPSAAVGAGHISVLREHGRWPPTQRCADSAVTASAVKRTGWEPPSGLGAVVCDAGGRPEARGRPLWSPAPSGCSLRLCRWRDHQPLCQEAPPSSSSLPTLKPLEGTTVLSRALRKRLSRTFACRAATLSRPCHPLFPGAPPLAGKPRRCLAGRDTGRGQMRGSKCHSFPRRLRCESW